ncbi:hypothetical protein A0H81_01840 [Grifola frondosa]|uniref:Uncharacterized protein n=1 Tax=Grifola frondosa TaxID=5627 RepID=A0A1C7MN03_GRIFR|nr:hypothetical protein A0H81_01840 [Grifola frondosa]
MDSICGVHGRNSRKQDSHFGQGSMDSSTADLDATEGLSARTAVEGLQGEVLIRKDAILAIVDAESDTG